MSYQYSSRDFSRILDVIEKKVREMAKMEGISRTGPFYRALMEYIAAEREACTIRAARAEAEARRRRAASTKEKNDG